ncbi:hypothetical protein [Microcoleus sp. FACHB-68]|nr:hypothetical protein [Microcoleus sp. FACHB-68]
MMTSRQATGSDSLQSFNPRSFDRQRVNLKTVCDQSPLRSPFPIR